MYIIVIVLGLCLWYVSTIQEGASNKKKKRRANTPTDEGAILNEKMDAILALEDRISAIEETIKLNSDNIKNVILTEMRSIIG